MRTGACLVAAGTQLLCGERVRGGRKEAVPTMSWEGVRPLLSQALRGDGHGQGQRGGCREPRGEVWGSVICGVGPQPGMRRAPLAGGRSGAWCREQCHSCRWPLRGEAGVQAAGSSEGWTWVLCQREGTRPGRSALGREIDAPGQTSAVTLGPRPWQLPNPVPAAHPPASPEPRDSAEAGRGRGREQAFCRRARGGQPQGAEPRPGAQAPATSWSICASSASTPQGPEPTALQGGPQA